MRVTFTYERREEQFNPRKALRQAVIFRALPALPALPADFEGRYIYMHFVAER